MANNEAGAFLNITPDVLKKLDSFDEKLEMIEKHAHTAADALKNGFGSVVMDTSKLESVITSLAKKIDAIKGNPFEGAGKGAEETTRKTTSLNESLSRAADLLNRIGNNKIGEGSFANFNISGLKQGYSDLKKYVENMDLSKPQQKAAVEAMRYMKMELDEQRKTDEQRAQSKEKETERRIAADRRAYKASADLAKAQNYKQNTTAQGALDFSKTANTLQRQITAIEYLKKARLSLNTTDANYKSTLEQINQAIAKHNQALTEAGVKSQQLATRHRNLMDTAGQLSRQLALVFSVSQIEGYISKLANVRGEFELQQRSLEAILQNKAQADQIFNKTVQLAVKSPFQIKELVTFTKQLAAYRIESDKLYDTTKRLADVSAGLGVDMGRLILAYGQVKAAAYLRGTEVRQFTEAGINMYGELQKLFKTRDQADYTTAQIVDMISKRKVTFEDVEQVFENLTSKEGIFYNMQEIQAETLQGKISNLKDSIDVMLNSIGKANEDTLKGSIDSIKVLIDNWETVAEVAKTFGVVVGSLLLVPKIKAITKEVSLLSFALTKAETSLRSLGLAFKSSLPLMALGVALQLVNELWNVHSQYNKMLRESSNKYYTAQLRVGEIDEIAKNNTRDALSSLVKEMNNEGFEIQIKPNISEKEAKEQFEEYRKQYTDFLEDIRKIEANYAENRKKGWLIGDDDIETDLDEYENSFNDFIAKGNKIQAELLRLSEESTSLGKGAKEYIQELVKGKKEGEDLIDYYKRLADYLEKLQNGVLFAGKKSSIASSFLGTRKDWEKDKEKAVKEIREIFDSVNDEVIKGNKTREQFKILINKGEFSKEWSDIKKQLAYDIYNLGDIKVPLRPGVNKEEPESDSKHKRDILAERISLIKELNKEYEKLSKVMGSDKAAKTVMERYADSLKNVNMPKNIIGDAFLPNKQNTAKALQEISKIITDFRKKQGAINDSYQLLDSDDVENIKKQLDKTKKNIEAMFNGLDLHKKLKDAGLSEAEVQQLFPGLAKTLDDVQRSIDIEFQTKYADTYKDPNTQQYKDYQDAIKEIDQQRIKEQQDTAERLIKSYKAQLSEQLQLDEQYYKDLEEIRDKFQNAPDLQKRLEENATKMYNQKSANNAWKEFTSSDSYLNLFDNIEYYSTAALQSMKDKLVKMREELKDLSPTELKQIMEQEEKLDKQLNQRDPWNKLTKSIKEYTKLRKENAKNEKDEAKARDLQAKYEKQLRTQSKIVAEKKAAYESATENIDAALEEYEVEKNNYDLLVDKKKEQDKIIAGYDAANRALSQQAQKLQGIIQSLGKIDLGGGMVESISGITNSVSDFAHMLEDSFGVAIGEDLYEILDGVGALFGSLESFDITKPISSSLNVLTGLGKTIGSIFGIGNKNKKKEREIQRQIKNIESLGRAYDELKEKMEAAWSADDLRTQTKDTIANLDQQIESYENMINSEEAKKDSDRGRIDEWNDAINELKKTRQEILDQQKLELGGIGGESEYKDAASSFVQAWMDAFNETEDGLKALNENFDSFIENLIVKQATMRLAQGRLKELFEKIDESVTEGSVGGINLTKEELANIQALGESALKGLNEDLLALMETLGYKGTSVGQKSELSALQQGIQAMSEETAGELQALLNSIRWFVSQQTTDVTAIRNILESEYLSSGDGSSNPMLIELKSQTEYLKLMSDNFESILSYSGNSKGRGIRVFMQ
jgi:DNA repair exonuclease SbcCD ATPase subunit|nr:MAG TPA_asm: tail tape measure [Caudoviricetes sp.]